VGRRLGQHFLFDPGILARIAAAAAPVPVDTILEIGPGKGPLTAHLSPLTRRLIAIEADRELAAALEAHPPGPNLEIISGDALRVDWPRADVIAGNIPYQITTPLIERALEHRPQRIVFLMQKEVADRLAASPGSKQYGALSVGVQLEATIERLFTVRAGAFTPPPKVDSAVVRITPKERGTGEQGHGGTDRTRELIQALFQRRRQQLQRSLREYLDPRPTTHDSRSLIAQAGLDPLMRPEEMAPEQFAKLARLIDVA
jgi:16S rRNA (adenine1518-N6/adenine1519-N6)-dimethyltransferase